jgi:hypothetical protein
MPANKPPQDPKHNSNTAIANTPQVPLQGATDSAGRAVQTVSGAGFYAQQKPTLIDTPDPQKAYPWQSTESNKMAYVKPVPP